MTDWLHGIFQRAPEIALFLSIAIGYLVGRLRVGTWRVGTPLGTLVVATLLSLIGVRQGNGVHTVLTALFLYAVGFEAAPPAWRVLRATAWRAVGLAVVYLVALGVVALSLPPLIGTGAATSQLLAGIVAPVAGVGHVAALASMVSLVCTLLVCGVGVPLLMHRSLRDDGIRANLAVNAGVPVLGPGQQQAAPDLVGRLYRVASGAALTVAEVEGDGVDDGLPQVAVSRIRRGGRFVEPAPSVRLAIGDVVLVVGRREAVLGRARSLGEEVQGIEGMELSLLRREVVVTRSEFDGRSIGDIRRSLAPGLRTGVVVVQMSRMGRVLPLGSSTVLHRFDVLTLHGTEADVARVAALAGDPVVPTARTDLMVLSGGLVLGLLLGVPEVTVGDARLGLGPGGALVAGLLVGVWHARRRGAGAIPGGAMKVLKEFSTAALVGLVALTSGASALAAVQGHGGTLFGAALALGVVPLLAALCAGRFVLGFSNGASLAGALSGATLNAPALGDVLHRTDSAVPVTPFLVASLVAGAGGQLLLWGLA